MAFSFKALKLKDGGLPKVVVSTGLIDLCTLIFYAEVYLFLLSLKMRVMIMTRFNLYENHESEENNFSRSARDEKDNRDRVNRLAGVPRR